MSSIPFGDVGSRVKLKGTETSTSSSGSFVRFEDRYESIEEVQDALRAAQLESSEIIIAVDFTKSNEHTGKHSFGGANDDNSSDESHCASPNFIAECAHRCQLLLDWHVQTLCLESLMHMRPL